MQPLSPAALPLLARPFTPMLLVAIALRLATLPVSRRERAELPVAMLTPPLPVRPPVLLEMARGPLRVMSFALALLVSPRLLLRAVMARVALLLLAQSTWFALPALESLGEVVQFVATAAVPPVPPSLVLMTPTELVPLLLVLPSVVFVAIELKLGPPLRVTDSWPPVALARIPIPRAEHLPLLPWLSFRTRSALFRPRRIEAAALPFRKPTFRSVKVPSRVMPMVLELLDLVVRPATRWETAILRLVVPPAPLLRDIVLLADT